MKIFKPGIPNELNILRLWFFPKDDNLGLWSQIRVGLRRWGVRVSEKVSRHGIVGPMKRPGPAAPNWLFRIAKIVWPEKIRTHFLFENRSLVDFEIGNGPFHTVGQHGGRCWWKWQFPLRKTRCALLIFWIGIPYLKIDHWSIFKYGMNEKVTKSRVASGSVFSNVAHVNLFYVF